MVACVISLPKSVDNGSHRDASVVSELAKGVSVTAAGQKSRVVALTAEARVKSEMWFVLIPGR